MKTLPIGLVLAVAPWVVFDIVDAMNPHAILFGLGIFVSFCGAIVVVVGLANLFGRFAARQKLPE